MKIVDVAPGSEAWRLARAGSLGASSLHEAVARVKNGWGASRANLQARLIAERLTGLPSDTFTSEPMRRGLEVEPEARAAYQFEVGVLVEQVGMVLHPTITGSHCSPDGIVGVDGVLEIKSPNTSTHIDTLLGDPIPHKYVCQVQWALACTGRAWCDWVSYDNRLPESMRLYVQRISRDDLKISELEAQVREFLAELEAKLAALTSRYGAAVREAA